MTNFSPLPHFVFTKFGNILLTSASNHFSHSSQIMLIITFSLMGIMKRFLLTKVSNKMDELEITGLFRLCKPSSSQVTSKRHLTLFLDQTQKSVVQIVLFFFAGHLVDGHAQHFVLKKNSYICHSEFYKFRDECLQEDVLVMM